MMAIRSPSSPKTQARQGWSFMLHWTGCIVLIVIAMSVFASLIFWDANFYVARDRWEHFKNALSGEWKNTGWCPPGENIPGCRPQTDLEEALSKVDNLHFFKVKAVEGSSLTITTGANYVSANTVLKGQPVKQWCYIAYGEETVKSHLDLAEQIGTEKPTYTHLDQITPKAFSTLGISIQTLQELTKTHCQFGIFEQPIKTGED